MTLRVAVVGNVAGAGVRRLRSLLASGFDAWLFVSAYETGTSDPRGRTDRYSVWTWPPRRLEGDGAPLRLARRAGVLLSLLRLNAHLLRFDFAHVLALNVGYGIGWHRDLVAELTGSDVAEQVHAPTLLAQTTKLGWRLARAIIAPNGDTLFKARLLGLEPTFVPLEVDTDLFRPLPPRDDGRFVVFHPARHDWGPGKKRHKGNDVLLRGVAEYVRSGGDVELRCVRHGDSVELSRTLIRELGIETRVHWSDLLDMPVLAAECQRADVVADQFQIGSFGQAGPDALACGRPLLTHLSEDFSLTYGEAPPYLEASTPAEVCEALARARSATERERLGQAARAWIMRHHSEEAVASKLRAVYRSLGSARSKDA